MKQFNVLDENGESHVYEASDFSIALTTHRQTRGTVPVLAWEILPENY